MLYPLHMFRSNKQRMKTVKPICFYFSPHYVLDVLVFTGKFAVVTSFYRNVAVSICGVLRDLLTTLSKTRQN